ncbi:MAG TPA: 5-(carboxyamino)imidazole ribonucleotide synthase [Gemmatimonadaceae bacterium]|nr:5-(carboxyamino)imidazole ribonucleotide synthase [Gemmatimonadaceae bacterium]
MTTITRAGVIAPGATIGFLGGGQLGRMTALAARSMGFRIHVLDPDPECSASPVADRCVAARFDDVDAARELARHCDVITLEIEQIATSVIDAAAAYAPARPGSELVGIIQDRGKQKAWLARNGFPLGEYREVRGAPDVADAVTRFGATFVKTCRGGYDGRSQVRVVDASDAEEAWQSLGERPAVAERALDLAAELSIMTARRPSGDVAVFPAALNHHERQVLAWSVIPAPLDPAIVARATEIGRGIAEQMQLEGLLAVEMFLTTAGEILVNELAPRPHNSFHATERACVTSQFEQLTRAVCDLPLGDVSVVRPAAIVNLFGDIWRDGAPDFAASLSDPRVRLHLYGKGARAGRKMGHISAVGGSAFSALAAARDASARAGAMTDDVPESVRPFLKNPSA